jgi:hypothetical protein
LNDSSDQEVVRHVVEHAPEKPPDQAVVDAAESAVALAHATAAHAELEAAESVREIERGADEWRTQTSNSLDTLAASVLSMNSREEERHRRETELHERLNAIEARLPPIQESSNEEPAEESPAEEENPAGEVAEAGESLSEGGESEAASSEIGLPEAENDRSVPRKRHTWT